MASCMENAAYASVRHTLASERSAAAGRLTRRRKTVGTGGVCEVAPCLPPNNFLPPNDAKSDMIAS